MSVYPVSAEKASDCRVSGCLCRSRMVSYPSDLTDVEWEILRPEAAAVMAELRRGPGGRPMEHELRAMVDAVRYMTKYGIEWRAMPVDFPPYEAVYAFFYRWSARGLPQRLVDRLRGRLRVGAGRGELPTAGSIDSASVKVPAPADGPVAGFGVPSSARSDRPRSSRHGGEPTHVPGTLHQRSRPHSQKAIRPTQDGCAARDSNGTRAGAFLRGFGRPRTRSQARVCCYR
jgi:transposase